MADDSQSIILQFLDDLLADVEREATLPLSEYQRRWPGYEEAIAVEYARLVDVDATSLPIDRGDGESSVTPRGGVSPGAPEATGLTGRVIGGYRLVRELGHGGQGYVWEAEDRKLHRRVALKILPGGVRFSPAARLRFQREAETASRLEHPGIVRVHEFGEDEGALFIAMELVKGKPLAQHISETAVLATPAEGVTQIHVNREDDGETSADGEHSYSRSPSSDRSVERDAIRRVVGFIESAARALHAAHGAGLVHRDVKPGNLMVRDDGSACVLDFGLAQDDLGVTLTQTGDLMGTPAYMSPEQLLAQRVKLDRRSDVYSLGVCLFEACTLRRPFEESSQQELYRSIAQREPPAPGRLNSKVPKDLEAIILTAIDKDRNRRYATALDLAEDLARFRAYQPVAARPAGPLLKAQRWIQRNKVVAASALVVFAVLIAASAVFYWKGEEAGRERDRADEQAKIARQEARRASLALEKEQAALNEKTRALDDYDRLADIKRLEAAIAASDALYPPSPALVPELEAWKREFGPLVDRLVGHESFLTELRARALPYTEAERERDFAGVLAEIRRGEEALARCDRAIAESRGDEERQSYVRQRDRMVKRLAELERTKSARRSWSFEDQTLQFQHDVLADLVTDLKAFSEDERGAVKSVEERLDQSGAIERATLGGEMAARWAACRERIESNPVYAGLDLEPQLGLIPLGPDPDSELEEFLHWLTHEGEIPERDPESETIAITEDLGVVLVLIPGGTFLMGAQKKDPAKPNFNPSIDRDEGPVHEVKLDAYFLSKYEMTQAQWLRAFGSNPSQYFIGALRGHPMFKADVTGRHPVERVSWHEARALLPRLDLQLPTEAEWERAARGGRSDQVFAGASDVAELRRFANINGLETRVANFTNQEPGHRDEWILHAPVGSFAPNDFGLHDMTGNVREWCRDGMFSYSMVVDSRGMRGDPGAAPNLICRGGSFNDPAHHVRVSDRFGSTADDHDYDLGLRPGRKIR